MKLSNVNPLLACSCRNRPGWFVCLLRGSARHQVWYLELFRPLSARPIPDHSRPGPARAASEVVAWPSGSYHQGFFSQSVSGNRRPPVPVYRTGWTGNRLNSNPNSNKFKNSHATGSDWFTGRFDQFTGRFYRFTGRFDRFEIQKLPCNRFTGRFDRFDWWALMSRLIFFFFDLTLNPRKLY